MRPNTNPVFTALTAANSQASNAQWATDIVRASFQAVVTGSGAAGSFQAQASNDKAFGAPPNQFVPTNWSNLGSSVAVAAAGIFFIPAIECSYEYLRLIYTSTATGVETVAPIADTGSFQAQTVSTVADVAGNLNSTWFNLSSINLVTKLQKDFYVWLDNGTGVDPLVAGRTGIQVTYTNGDTADALATAIRAALNALTNDFTATGATNAVITHSKAAGPVTVASDGTAPTTFTFGSATLGVVSNLINKYFLLEDEAGAHKYFVWNNVDSIGTAPTVSGYTAAPVVFASGSSAGTIGTALASAIAALNSTNSFTTSGTTTVSITMKTAGPFVPAVDVNTGFTIVVTTPSGTISANMSSKAL